MKETRSGARSRFLIWSSPETFALRGEMFTYNILLGFAPLIGMLIGFSVLAVQGIGMLSDPNAPLWRLGQPLSAAEQARGRVHWSGILRGEGPEPGVPPLCLVTHSIKSGKNTTETWRKTLGTASIELPDGTIHPLSLQNVRWEPEMLGDGDVRERTWRQVSRIASGGWFEDQCLGEGQPMFVDGCRRTDRGGRMVVGSCGRGDPLVITPGPTAQPRIDELAGDLAGRLAGLAAALTLLLAYGWLIVRGRPLASALVRWNEDSDKPAVAVPKWLLYGGGALLLGGWLLLLLADLLLKSLHMPGYPQGSQWGYIFAYAVISCGTLLGALVYLRRRKLQAAMAPVLATPTVPLRRPWTVGDLVELAVRVKTDVAKTLGPLTGAPRAFAGVTVDRVYRSGKHHRSMRDSDTFQPSLLPIEDESGDGLLDLTHAMMDVRAQRLILRSGDAELPRYYPVLGESTSQSYAAFVVEERYLEPGEPLYVLGRVQRREASPTEQTYRAAAGIPVVGGCEEAKLIVHAGSEQDLLKLLRRERRYLDVTLLTVLSFVVATIATMVATMLL